jgi:hypothetical protein
MNTAFWVCIQEIIADTNEFQARNTAGIEAFSGLAIRGGEKDYENKG